MAPVFFLPHLPHAFEEASFAHIAKKVKRPIPILGARVYSISFELDGVLWVATVGESLRGYAPTRIKGQEPKTPVIEDPGLVVAIFPGEPHCVITAGFSNTPSRFPNPFYAAPKVIELFAVQRGHRRDSGKTRCRSERL